MSAKIPQILSTYRDLMEEEKLRVGVIAHLTQPASALPSPIVREACYLQLRMVCELIALGCLLVHEDIPATKSPNLTKRREADYIIKKMEELHPNFYPVPIRRESVSHIVGTDPTLALPKEELLRLYAQCGGHLHNGSLKKLLSAKSPVETKFDDVQRWRTKVIALLNEHYISTLSGEAGFICLMKNPENGKVQVAYAQAVPAIE